MPNPGRFRYGQGPERKGGRPKFTHGLTASTLMGMKSSQIKQLRKAQARRDYEEACKNLGIKPKPEGARR